ncbi:hypothetical protein SRHO_G00123740 [Serrasalmus rhombeus]
MPPKASKESLQSATGVEDSISREASQATSDEDLPLVWEKVSNKILKTINERFDKFELSFQTLQSMVQTVTEKLNVAEEQIQEHEARISSLETALTETQRKNELLRPIVCSSPNPEKEQNPHDNARVHFYTEKGRILRLRAGRNLDYNGHKVYIFPDYTAEVLEPAEELQGCHASASSATGDSHAPFFHKTLCPA